MGDNDSQLRVAGSATGTLNLSLGLCALTPSQLVLLASDHLQRVGLREPRVLL